MQVCTYACACVLYTQSVIYEYRGRDCHNWHLSLSPSLQPCCPSTLLHQSSVWVNGVTGLPSLHLQTVAKFKVFDWRRGLPAQTPCPDVSIATGAKWWLSSRLTYFDHHLPVFGPVCNSTSFTYLLPASCGMGGKGVRTCEVSHKGPDHTTLLWHQCHLVSFHPTDRCQLSV